MAIQFQCTQCGEHLSIDPQWAGKQAKCPRCAAVVNVPDAASVAAPAPPTQLICPSCGAKNPENNFRCTECGFVLHTPAQPQSAGDALSVLIPYKNAQSLWAYYLGVFSLIPCLGIPLGVAALILGIRGLKYAGVHPEAKGKAHAWVGIVLGTLCALLYGGLLLLAILGAVMSKR